MKLTKEQAIVISAYTGILCCDFSLLHKDVEKRLGNPVQIYKFADRDFEKKLKKLYQEDFISICF